MVFLSLQWAAAEALDRLTVQGAPLLAASDAEPSGATAAAAALQSPPLFPTSALVTWRARFVAKTLFELYSIFGIGLAPFAASSTSPSPSVRAKDDDVAQPRATEPLRLPPSKQHEPTLPRVADTVRALCDASTQSLVAAERVAGGGRGGGGDASSAASDGLWSIDHLLGMLRLGADVVNVGDTSNEAETVAASLRSPTLASIGFRELIAITRQAVCIYASRSGQCSGAPTQRNPPPTTHGASAPSSFFERCRQSLPFPNDGDVLMSVDDLQTFLRIAASAAASAAAAATVAKKDSTTLSLVLATLSLDGFFAPGKALPPGGWCTVLICPRVSPPNPSRLLKNTRVALIQNYCDMRDYNEMLAGANPCAALQAASNGSGDNNGRRPTKPTAQLVGRAAAKSLGIDPAELQAMATIVSGGRSGQGIQHKGVQAKESYATFMKDLSIGVDMRLMSLAGGIVGYYLCYSRGQSMDLCLAGAAVGAVAMLMVDAVLLLIRLGREDKAESTLTGRNNARRRQGNNNSSAAASPAASELAAIDAKKKS